MERAEGIEPSSVAWKATALPLCYARLALACCDLLAPSDRGRQVPARSRARDHGSIAGS